MKPFLMQFVIDRIEPEVGRFELSYNEQTDMNDIITKVNDIEQYIYTTGTNTRVKAEAPDYTQLQKSSLLYQSTKTTTEVKTEKPDVLPESLIIEFLATNTYTKTIGERPDID